MRHGPRSVEILQGSRNHIFEVYIYIYSFEKEQIQNINFKQSSICVDESQY